MFSSKSGHPRLSAVVFCLALAALTALPFVGGIARAEEPPRKSVTAELKAAIDRARDRVFPSLVSIVNVREYYAQGRKRLTRSGGSGTIITDQGHIVTNAHVAQDGSKFKVILADKREIDATLVGEDPLSDIAILKLDLEQLGPDVHLPVAQFGDSTKLDIGEYVMAMGAPWGMSRSMSLGVINNNDRVLSSMFQDDADYESSLGRDQPTGSFYRWLQHDAAIAPGNSGGPLVNLKGEIVGVNTRGSIFAGNMAFASPSSVVKDIAADLIEFGEVVRSHIGIRFKPIKKTGHDHGVFVNSVAEDSPADRAGLKPGDLITALDGKDFTVRYVEELPGLMRDLSDRKVGSEVRVTYERDGQKSEATIITEKYEKDRGDREELKKWGVTIQEMTARMARNRRLPNHDGVLVTGVEVGRPAQKSKPPLQRGDIIHSIDGQEVIDMAALKKIYGEMMSRDELPEFVLVDFERRAGRYLALLEPADDEDDERPKEFDKAWIGIEVQPVVKDLAKQIGIKGKRGFRVVRIYRDTVAASSELQTGDIITKLNDAALKPRNEEDQAKFQRKVKRLELGTQVKLTLLRDGSQLEIIMDLEPTRERPDEAKRKKDRIFDFEVRNITFFDIADRRWKPDTTGVMVIQVETGGWAGVGHLRRGDLLVQIDDHKVDRVKTFKKIMKEIENSRPEKVRFLVMRGIHTRFLFIETDWEDMTD